MAIPKKTRALVAIGWVSGSWMLSAAPNLEEGIPAVFRTGDTPERITQSLSFSPGTIGVGPTQLEFEIGFSTQETPSESGFLDSFTLSAVGGTNHETAAVVLTLDGFGATVLPESPGALLLSATSLKLRPVTGQFTDPQAVTTLAFAGIWDLPHEFQGQEWTVSADLFGNGNGHSSVGYLILSHPRLVPEPAVWVLLGLGLAGWFLVTFSG
jgi:hypothetical protein